MVLLKLNFEMEIELAVEIYYSSRVNKQQHSSLIT